MEVPIRIIQISDIHLFEGTENSLLGVNTQESFQAILEQIKSQQPSVDLIILSGDLSQDYSVGTYQRLADLLSVFNTPVYYVPGNHDDPKAMASVYPRGVILDDRTILLDKWQIVFLNSQKDNSVAGYLAPDQFKLLEDALIAYPDHHTIIVLHHQPISVGSAWLDGIGLTNSAELWELLGRYSQVHTILFGHVHQQFEGKKNGVKLYSTPSCCIQFKPNQNNFGLDNIPPGYRQIELFPDGTLTTQVFRLPNYIGEFEDNAKGY